jgi:hypothetical protein
MPQQKTAPMKSVSTSQTPVSAHTLDTDILIGMKAICSFLRMSEATVLKWLREYDDLPVKKKGVYISSRVKLNAWFHEYLERK